MLTTQALGGRRKRRPLGHPTVIRVAAGLLMLGGLAWGSHTARGQLPAESQLPGAAAGPRNLPGEATLPGAAAGAVALPGEDQLAGQPLPADGNTDLKDSAPIQGNAPILRLAYDGHTGIIRTLDLSDGGRTLVTAGEDKDVHVWRRTDLGTTGWMHLRTLRWPVTRGPSGRVYAARLNDDLVAFAGNGAFGSLGEIRLVNAASGNLLATLADDRIGHRQNLLSLAWSPASEPRLASLDMQGRLMTWQADPVTGAWRGSNVFDGDSTYGDAVATNLFQYYRGFAAVTFAGPNHLIMPRFVGEVADPKGVANWHLQRFDLRGNQFELWNDLDHAWYVRDLVATDDGRVLASCDGHRTVGIWTFNADGSKASVRRIDMTAPPLAIDLDTAGKWLLVGTELSDQASGGALLQLWDVAADPPSMLSQRTVSDHVRAIAIDAQRGEAIIAQGTQIQIHSFDAAGVFSSQAAPALTVPVQPALRVAFHHDGYQIGMGWTRKEDGQVALERVFDLAHSKLLGRGAVDPTEFLAPQRTAERWQISFTTVDQAQAAQLQQGDQPRGVLPLVGDRHGWPTALCTLPVPPQGNEDPQASPATAAVIVGTSGRNQIFAYKANDANPPQLLRQFRDHWGEITSLSTSADGRYLVSAAEDATISVWNLQDMLTASKLVNLWGADFEIEGEHLIASEVREDGPLYFRGVREGDRLVLIEWQDWDETSFAKSNPAEIRQSLQEMPFDLLVHFKFARLGRPGPDFQSLPAWRPLATLFVDQDREWAFWTPAGYYDASFNGHQRFGWQINHGRDQEVDYFRAAQFRKLLERGDVMRRLLAAGSLPAAMRQTVTQIEPPPAEDAIVNQIETRPRIRLLSPDPSKLVEGETLTVLAEIEVPAGASLVEPKAFVSGVPAIAREQVANRPEAAADAVTYQWQFRLPSDPRLQLEILAATDSESIDRVLVDLEHHPPARPAKPRLHVLAIGASQYRDSQIQSLDFAAQAAGQIVELFRVASAPIYRTSGDQLVNTDATRPLWRVFAQTAAEELRRTVSPDDLVIMYLCGHGLRDDRTNQWYFVTADARFSDLMNDRYGDCIAFSDLAALAALPCRKLAILDSCHSGAVQPLMQRDDLKSALRFLQDDVVLAITASEGDEEAAEQREDQLGRFTAALVDALRGQAPELDQQTETVSLTEVIDYVSRRVSQESEQAGMPQHPTASPSYLLRTLTLPLTSRP